MAIYVKTDRPHTVVRKLRELINEMEIDTWILDEDNDFTHKSSQWRELAWIHPFIEEERVVFAIIGSQSKPLTRVIYGVYMGRFVECLIMHVDSYIQSIRVSAKPSTIYDSYRG